MGQQGILWRSLGASLLLLLAGCSAMPSSAGGEDEVPRLDDKVVLIYMPGSTQEFRRDPCLDTGWERLGDTPRWFLALDQTNIGGWPVYAKTFCTATKVGEFRSGARAGTPKVVKRAADIGKHIDLLQAQGAAPERIFLVGNSAGAWASLLVAVDQGLEFNAMIGMAPAFAGPRNGRDHGWWWIREQLIAQIKTADQIDGLVFAFEKDPFERPADLKFIAGISGVEFVALPSDLLGGISCGDGSSHMLHHRACFAQTQVPRILQFIEDRLPPPEAAGS